MVGGYHNMRNCIKGIRKVENHWPIGYQNRQSDPQCSPIKGPSPRVFNRTPVPSLSSMASISDSGIQNATVWSGVRPSVSSIRSGLFTRPFSTSSVSLSVSPLASVSVEHMMQGC